MERTNQPRSQFPDQVTIDEDLILSHISSQSFLVVNKKILQILGPNQTILLSNLIDKYQYFRDRGRLVKNEWFFLTREKQMEQTGLTEHHWNTSRSELENRELIVTKRMGVPARLHYKIDLRQIWALIKTSLHRSTKQDYMSSQNYYKETKNKETINKDKKLKKDFFGDSNTEKYSIHSKGRWRNGMPIDYQSFVEYFNEVSDSQCRMSPTKKTDIKKQLKTFSAQEIKKALDNRSIMLADNKYLTSWDSIFSRKIERMEKYVNANPNKSSNKPDTGYQSSEYEYQEADEIV